MFQCWLKCHMSLKSILCFSHCTVYLFCASCGTTGGSFGVLKTTLRGIFWRKVLGKSCWYCYYPLLIWKITEKWSKGKIFKKYILGGLGNTPLEGILEKKFQAKVVCIHFPSTYQKKSTTKVQREKSFFFPLVPYAYSLCIGRMLVTFFFLNLLSSRVWHEFNQQSINQL